MESQHDQSSAVQVCFFIFFAITASAIALTAFVARAPLIFTIAGLGMAGFVIILMIVVQRSRPRQYDMHDSPDFVPLRAEQPTRHGVITEKERIVYQSPTHCPRCGASISSETVDWVGPLQVRCPYCSATIDAVGRTI